MKKNVKEATQHKILDKQTKDDIITPEDIAKFNKKVVKVMVKALTSKEGYEVIKELSKR